MEQTPDTSFKPSHKRRNFLIAVLVITAIASAPFIFGKTGLFKGSFGELGGAMNEQTCGDNGGRWVLDQQQAPAEQPQPQAQSGKCKFDDHVFQDLDALKTVVSFNKSCIASQAEGTAWQWEGENATCVFKSKSYSNETDLGVAVKADAEFRSMCTDAGGVPSATTCVIDAVYGTADNIKDLNIKLLKKSCVAAGGQFDEINSQCIHAIMGTITSSKELQSKWVQLSCTRLIRAIASIPNADMQASFVELGRCSFTDPDYMTTDYYFSNAADLQNLASRIESCVSTSGTWNNNVCAVENPYDALKKSCAIGVSSIITSWVENAADTSMSYCAFRAPYATNDTTKRYYKENLMEFNAELKKQQDVRAAFKTYCLQNDGVWASVYYCVWRNAFYYNQSTLEAALKGINAQKAAEANLTNQISDLESQIKAKEKEEELARVKAEAEKAADAKTQAIQEAARQATEAAQAKADAAEKARQEAETRAALANQAALASQSAADLAKAKAEFERANLEAAKLKVEADAANKELARAKADAAVQTATNSPASDPQLKALMDQITALTAELNALKSQQRSSAIPVKCSDPSFTYDAKKKVCIAPVKKSAATKTPAAKSTPTKPTTTEPQEFSQEDLNRAMQVIMMMLQRQAAQNK